MTESDISVIFVGKKPLMSYVLATVMHLNGDTASAAIKARGKAISKAVDVAEVVRNKFVNDAVLERIEIGTEVLQNEAGNKTNVSFIEIFLSRSSGLDVQTGVKSERSEGHDVQEG